MARRVGGAGVLGRRPHDDARGLQTALHRGESVSAGLENAVQLEVAAVPSGSTLAENIRAVDAFLAVPADVRFEKGDVVEVELLGTVTR